MKNKKKSQSDLLNKLFAEEFKKMILATDDTMPLVNKLLKEIAAGKHGGL